MNELEQTTFDGLVKQFGQIWHSNKEGVVKEKLGLSRKLFKQASKDFVENSSAYNYNMLQCAMLCLQYWSQKKSQAFTIEADF